MIRNLGSPTISSCNKIQNILYHFQMFTRLDNLDPLNPHFHKIKLVFTELYIALIYKYIVDTWFLRVPTIYVLSKTKKKDSYFSSENLIKISVHCKGVLILYL